MNVAFGQKTLTNLLATIIYKIDDLLGCCTVNHTRKNENTIINLLASTSNLTMIGMFLVNMFLAKFQVALHDLTLITDMILTA